MQKKTIDGHEVEFELADDNFPSGIVMPFRIKSIDGVEYDTYQVVIGKSDNEAGVPKDPFDGHVCATCHEKEDAIMVSAAIRTAKRLAEASEAAADVIHKEAEKAREKAKRGGWDVDKAEAKMDELIKQGKSSDEIVAYMNEHMDDFKKTDAPKSEEEW